MKNLLIEDCEDIFLNNILCKNKLLNPIPVLFNTSNLGIKLASIFKKEYKSLISFVGLFCMSS